MKAGGRRRGRGSVLGSRAGKGRRGWPPEPEARHCPAPCLVGTCGLWSLGPVAARCTQTALCFHSGLQRQARASAPCRRAWVSGSSGLQAQHRTQHAGPGSRCPALRWGEALTPQGGQSDREPCLEKQSTSGTVTDRAGPVRGGLSGEPEPPRALAVRESGPNTDQGVRLPPGPPSALVTLDATENDDSVTRKSGMAEDLGAPCRTRQGLRGFAEPHLGEAAGPERARAQWISQRVARVRITRPPSGFGPSLLNAPSPHQSVPQDGGSSSP